MKLISTTFLVFVFVVQTIAQGPIWDAAKADSNFHPLAKHHWGIFLMGGAGFNTGKTVIPPMNPGNGPSYFVYSNPKDEPGFSFTAGIDYETKEISNKIYVSTGLSISIYSYNVKVSSTEYNYLQSKVTHNYDSLIMTTGSVSSGYSMALLSVPAIVHYCLSGSKWNRWAIGAGPSEGVIIKQLPSEYYTDDIFGILYFSGIVNLSYEHINYNGKVFKVELYSDFGLLSSPEGRRLGFVGIKLASLTSR